MCKLKVKLCTTCDLELESVLRLCENGKMGYLCVGPNTSSGSAYLKIARNSVTGKIQADMNTVVPSVVISITCADCSPNGQEIIID